MGSSEEGLGMEEEERGGKRGQEREGIPRILWHLDFQVCSFNILNE